MFLIIYVDDFKMSGPRRHFVEAWKGIVDAGIRLDEPTDLDHFLGCRHIKRTIQRDDGTVIQAIEYDFECSLRAAVDKYRALARECGVEIRLDPRPTPYRREPVHEHGLPAQEGPCVACPWCKGAFSTRGL